MKRSYLALIGVLLTPAVHAAIDPATPVEIDQEVYERVFIACVQSFKSQDVAKFDDLDKAIRQCGSQAGHIAIRKGVYRIDEGADWLRAKPYVKEEIK